LSGIFGYTQLTEINLNNPEKAKGYISQIMKGARRAADLVKQILTFSRKSEYEKHPISLYVVVKEALKLLRSSIPSTIEINEGISSKAKVLADSTQMHQVIMNLCTNAYHAIEEKGGILTVKLAEVDIHLRKIFLGIL
jgi:two-component system cell cycle sensor histidine kinase/response regulator CckA